MVDVESIQWITNNIFSISITIYLLYERSKFNEKITVALERVTIMLDLVAKKVL